MAGAALTTMLLTASCQGKVTIHSDKGTDTIEFNTDSILEININVQTNNYKEAEADSMSLHVTSEKEPE